MSSGVLIKGGYVITAAHSVLEDADTVVSELTIDGTAFDVICSDLRTDLALLRPRQKIKGITEAIISISNARPSDHISLIGCPESIPDSKTKGAVIPFTSLSEFMVDAWCAPGSSGGGVWNNNNELTGIMISMSNGCDVRTCFAASAHAIHAFLYKCNAPIN